MNIVGCAFFITKNAFEICFGYELLNDHSWGDKSLGISAYLKGYDTYIDPEISCIHKWHTNDEKNNNWLTGIRKTARFEYEHNLGASALKAIYVLTSKKYFEDYYLEEIKGFAGDNFENQYQKFLADLPRLEEYKQKFWQNTARSLKDYWLEYWDIIWEQLSIEEKRVPYKNCV